MSPRIPSDLTSKLRIPLIFVGVAVVLFGVQYLIGPWWTFGIAFGILALVGLILLVTTKTAFGQRAAAAVWRPISRTRIGKRIARRQLMWAAKARGIKLTDPTGRPLTDIEIQLELLDTPEARAIKKQLRNANPQQRAQALRMMQAQAEEAQRTGVVPKAVKPPRQRYGRPR